MSSRDIKDLSSEMRDRAAEWEIKMLQAGIGYLITCTRRTIEEQKSLYAQGRTKPGKKVTWTLKSKHINGDAFDFVIMVDGKPDWKMSHKDLWDKAIEFGKSLGLTQVIGKNGKVKEYEHLQMAV